MTFNQISNLSNTDYRVLFEFDLSKLNVQWVNIGSGIWYLNILAVYPLVDSSLLDGFSVQTFGDIGSVLVDSVHYTEVSTLLLVTSTETSFYYDSVNRSVYIHFVNNDDPILHNVFLGVTQGFSYDDFTPIGSSIFYDGRLFGDITIGEKRDPLYFGKIQYSKSDINLINADGYFDKYPDENDFYGNATRVLVGFNQLNISDYIEVFSGIVEGVTVTEEAFSIVILDKRKALTKSITYNCEVKNALEVIRELLWLHYGVIYNSVYYDMTAWANAETVAPTISIDIAEGKAINDISVIKLIEEICSSIFGLFIITSDGKYSFKIVDTTASASTVIYGNDIINRHEVVYDPTEVISSAKVGYSKNWEEGYTSPYTWYYDTTYESAVFTKYKIYNQKEFTTVLDAASAGSSLALATTFGSTVLLYSKDVHGIGTVNVPIKYYSIKIGDIVNIEINRENSTMIGTKKCEIISKSHSLKSGFIKFGYRII